MSGLRPGVPVDVNAVELAHEAVPAAQVAADKPTTGSVELGGLAGLEVGVWEMSVGAMDDVESDEVFLVTAGHATVQFHADGRVVSLAPGTLMRLQAGSATTWTVTEALRKVYLAP